MRQATQFLEGLAEDFELLRSNRQAWAEGLKERSLWEAILGDGLDSEEPCLPDELTAL